MKIGYMGALCSRQGRIRKFIYLLSGELEGIGNLKYLCDAGRIILKLMLQIMVRN
jgi:hypothetical protein